MAATSAAAATACLFTECQSGWAGRADCETSNGNRQGGDCQLLATRTGWLTGSRGSSERSLMGEEKRRAEHPDWQCRCSCRCGTFNQVFNSAVFMSSVYLPITNRQRDRQGQGDTVWKGGGGTDEQTLCSLQGNIN